MAEKGGICDVVWHFVTFQVVIVKLGGVGGVLGARFWGFTAEGAEITEGEGNLSGTNLEIRALTN